MADLDIPLPAAGPSAGPSYRVSRARRGGALDGGTKRLLIAAGGIGALLLLLTVGWAVSHRRSGVVPVIEADSRPIRVKPENAGGMQVVGADEQVMGDGAAVTAQSLVPPPEAPAASALRAQTAPALPLDPVGQPSAPQAVAAATLPASAGPGQALRDGAMAGQRASSPGQAPVSQAAGRGTANPPAGGAPTGNVQVQLAALDSEQAANGEWQRLARQMPDLLGQRRPAVQRAERDGKTVWRLRTGGFADIADATAFCNRVRAKGGSCSIANF